MSTLFQRFEPLRRPLATAGCFALALLIGGIDFLTGTEVSVAMFYLVPVGLTSWLLGRSMGLVMGWVCMAVWLAADLLGGTVMGHSFVSIWNAAMLEVVFIAAAYMTVAARETAESLQQTRSLLDAEAAEHQDTERRLQAANSALAAAKEQLRRLVAEPVGSSPVVQRGTTHMPEVTRTGDLEHSRHN